MDEGADPDTLTGPVPVRGPEASQFDALFLQEFSRVARTLHHIVGDRGRAEEVTQGAFFELLRNWDKVSHYDRPDLWVRRVAIRKGQRERHRSRRRVELERRTLATSLFDAALWGSVS